MRYELTVGKNILIADDVGVHFTDKKKIKNGDMRTLLYKQIKSVELVPALLAGGCLFFKTDRDSGTRDKGIVALQHEENAFHFPGRDMESAKRIKSAVDEVIFTNKEADPVAVAIPSEADELIKFKQLLDAGAITQDEYDTKKAQILGL